MMRFLGRLFYLSAIGLVGAAIVHLSIIFLLLELGTRTAARVVQAERLPTSVQNLASGAGRCPRRACILMS